MKYIIIFLLTIGNLVSFAQETDHSELYNTKKSIGLSGYDPVSYFDGKPLEGNTSIQYKFTGVVYLFSTKVNLEKFKANPESFEPQYGGWCAYAIGNSGEKVKVDPETYKIKNGKLYLFYNFWGTNTLELWNKEEVSLFKKAEVNWNKIKD